MTSKNSDKNNSTETSAQKETFKSVVNEYFGVLWPPITTEKKAQQYTYIGLGAALFVVGMYSIIYVLTIGKYLDYVIPPSFYMIIMLFSIVAFGLYNFSRTAAFVGLITFIPCWILLTKVIGVFLEVIMALLIIMFVAGVRGSLAYHKIQRKEKNSKSESISSVK